MDNITYAALNRIQDRDPDGGTTKPAESDYIAHQAWAVATYGQRVWDIYAAGGWGREPGYNDGGAYDWADYS